MAFECEAEVCEAKEMPEVESGMPTEENEIDKENTQEIQPEKSLQVEAAENILPDTLHNIDRKELSLAICAVLAGSGMCVKLLHTFAMCMPWAQRGRHISACLARCLNLLHLVTSGYILLHLVTSEYRNTCKAPCSENVSA